MYAVGMQVRFPLAAQLSTCIRTYISVKGQPTVEEDETDSNVAYSHFWFERTYGNVHAYIVHVLCAYTYIHTIIHMYIIDVPNMHTFCCVGLCTYQCSPLLHGGGGGGE